MNYVLRTCSTQSLSQERVVKGGKPCDTSSLVFLWWVIVWWEAVPSISPLNGCLCVVLVADLCMGGAQGEGWVKIYDRPQRGPAVSD